MRKLAIVGICGVAGFALLQVVRPPIPEKAPQAEIQVPLHIHKILEKDCYSCHSDQRRLEWYDEIQPAYFLVRQDVLTARERLNFSTLGSKPAAAQKAALFEAVNMIQLGAMPLPRFVALHHGARVTPDELAELKAYLAPWAPLPPSPPSPGPGPSSAGAALKLVGFNSVKPEPNGLAFDPTFESWQTISYTDRGDNNTFRFILGNTTAMQAIRSGKISPWPDGARIAKIAWQQALGDDGSVLPGKFIQVELMVKDAQKYAATDGWGWGRWRGNDLKPYGQDAGFVKECTGCHQPVKGNDYVYTLPMTTAVVPGLEVVNNRAAALPSTLPYQPLAWTPITMSVDRAAHTMSALLVNDVALKSVQRRGPDPKAENYSAGSVLSLLTWSQRDDPHWFGGRMPDSVISAEFVTVNGSNKSTYRRFDGQGLKESHLTTEAAARRVAELLGTEPVSLP